MAKVLVFYQYYCTPLGAWGTRHYELSRRWARAGHDVTIVTSIYDKSDLEPQGFISRYSIEGVEVIAVNVRLSNKHGLLKRLASFAAFSAVGAVYAATLPADVVVASSGPLTVALPGLVARWIRGRRLLFEVRDLLPEAAVQMELLKNPVAVAAARWVERLAYRSAEHVVALSPGMQPWIEAVAPGTSVVTVPNGADLELFHPDLELPADLAKRRKQKFVVLYAGTLGRANSGDEFLDIAAALRRRGEEDVEVLLLGDGAELQTLRQRAEREGLNHVTFLGKLPKTEVAKWHAVASVVMIGLKPFPILQTSSPNKLFDGLAAGRPILNNTPGWIADLLADNGCGFTYDPGDVEAAANWISTLRRDPETLAETGRNARRLAEEQFARDVLAQRYAELLG